jgi:serine/threonine protein kinase
MGYIDFTYNGGLRRFNLPARIESVAGETFILRYAIRKGGNGVVFSAYRAKHSSSSDCAVKFLRKLDAQRRDRFENEVRILATLDHPTISRHLGNGQLRLSDDVVVPWVAMDLGGLNLREHVDRHGPLNTSVLIPVALQMCEAVAYVHTKRLIHRDIKPDNFVWTGVDTIKMIDFGIAKFASENVAGRPLDQFTQLTEFVGPALYSSPELLAYARDKAHLVDHRSDLFQLAKSIWFIGTGRVSAGVPARSVCPFGGRLREGLIPAFSDDPDDRPGTAAELAKVLNGLV